MELDFLGAGRFVNIRGMDADLNGTTYDGVRMMANNPASPQGGARAVAFDAFPAGILGGLEVVKSFTPDMDAEGLGGVVNIQPRTIPEGQDHVLDASIGGGIETLRNSGVYKGDITVGKRFFDDKLSVIAYYGYQKDSRGLDDIEADYIKHPTTVPSGTMFLDSERRSTTCNIAGTSTTARARAMAAASVSARIRRPTSILRGFHAGYVETANKHEFVIADLAGKYPERQQHERRFHLARGIVALR